MREFCDSIFPGQRVSRLIEDFFKESGLNLKPLFWDFFFFLYLDFQFQVLKIVFFLANMKILKKGKFL